MQIHFYAYEHHDCFNGYKETERAIMKRRNTIRTTQMCFLSTRLFEMGYRVFVHNEKGKPAIEIRLGKTLSTRRVIKMAHNLFKLWQAGEFG